MNVTNEIVELHQFFERWFAATLAPSDANFARVLTALAPDFALISPDGRLAAGATVIDWLRGGYGTRPLFRLWTDKITVRHTGGELTLATYEEWQVINGVTSCRLSSALFRAQGAAPNGVVWLHVHETWLQPPV
jgi:hypothetical protein